MGKLEEQYRKRRKRADVQQLVLSTVAVAGMLSVALLAPNALQALKQLGMLPRKRHTDSIRDARNRLVEKGLLRWEGNILRLTDKGERQLRLWRLRDYGLQRPKRWDGRWRVLIFDIPEKRRRLRDQIRITLGMIGFVRLQDSVWVYPYDCEELITLLKAEYKIGKDLLYMIVDTIEYDTPLRNAFKLK